MKQAQGNRTLLDFLRNENGATAIEYALIAAGVSVAIIGGVTSLGTKVNSTWEYVSNAMK